MDRCLNVNWTSAESVRTRHLSNPSSNTAIKASPASFDLMRVPVVGALLRWRHARTFLQIPLLVLSAVMVLHGLLGPSLAPKNLATTLAWLHFRGLLVLVILGAGNFFCLACPFMLVRNFARRFARPWLSWPVRLRNKWLSVFLFAGILFVYELFDLYASPWWTASLVVAYFLAVLVVDGVFKHASFCKFVCPIGQFNFVASTLSPLEVRVRDPGVCGSCSTKDCIRGQRTAGPDSIVVQRGCELALFQPLKAGNMDCTFCLDCVHACPHDNVGIIARLPASELIPDPRRAGIGYLSRRKDLAALSMVFTFGALLNAFGMVSPVYALEDWLGRLLHISHEAPVLGLIFLLFLIVEPLLLLMLATWVTRVWAQSRRGWLAIMVRYTYSFIPLGFGMWLAHYGFHFFTGLYTFIPVTQSALTDLGWPIMGTPHWTWTGFSMRVVQPLEIGFLLLGLAGSLLVVRRLSEEEETEHPMRAFIPWASVCLLIWLGAMWLMFQPMEMRVTLMNG
jgi:ferredoxin